MWKYYRYIASHNMYIITVTACCSPVKPPLEATCARLLQSHILGKRKAPADPILRL